MRDALADMASELQVQAGRLDFFDLDAVDAWFRDCVQVLRAMRMQDREDQLVSYAIVLVMRARAYGQHDLSCREVKELLSLMLDAQERES